MCSHYQRKADACNPDHLKASWECSQVFFTYSGHPDRILMEGLNRFMMSALSWPLQTRCELSKRSLGCHFGIAQCPKIAVWCLHVYNWVIQVYAIAINTFQEKKRNLMTDMRTLVVHWNPLTLQLQTEMKLWHTEQLCLPLVLHYKTGQSRWCQIWQLLLFSLYSLTP